MDVNVVDHTKPSGVYPMRRMYESLSTDAIYHYGFSNKKADVNN